MYSTSESSVMRLTLRVIIIMRRGFGSSRIVPPLYHQYSCKPACTRHAHGVHVRVVEFPNTSLARDGIRLAPDRVTHPDFTQAFSQSNHGPSLSSSLPGLSIRRFTCRRFASCCEYQMCVVIRRCISAYKVCSCHAKVCHVSHPFSARLRLSPSAACVSATITHRGVSPVRFAADPRASSRNR